MELNVTPSRRILQLINEDSSSPAATGSSKEPPPPAAAALSPNSINGFDNKTSSAFDSSLALTVLVLLTALFFMGFFSIYIRHFSGGERGAASAAGDAEDELRRRHPSQSPRYHAGRKGLESAAVRALPAVSYGGPAEHAAEECPICLSEFELKEVVKVIPYCGHVFHATCIDTWLYSHVSCPLCRSTEFFKIVEEVRLDVTPPGDNHDGGSARRINGT